MTNPSFVVLFSVKLRERFYSWG